MLHPLQTKGKSTGCDPLRRWCWPWSFAKQFHQLSFFTDLQCFVYIMLFYRSAWFKMQNACLRWLKWRPFQNSSWAVSTSMSGSECAKCSWRVGVLTIDRKHGWCICRYPIHMECHIVIFTATKIASNKMHEFEGIMIVPYIQGWHRAWCGGSFNTSACSQRVKPRLSWGSQMGGAFFATVTHVIPDGA